jgi:hypothetical protein
MTKLPRSAKVIQGALAIAESELKQASEKRDALRRELRDAQVREATEKGHPWLGKKVQRQISKGYANRLTTQKGTLCVYDPNSPDHRGLRGIYSMAAGQLFVLSHGGKTGYKFYTPEQIERAGMSLYGEDKTPWELAS